MNDMRDHYPPTRDGLRRLMKDKVRHVSDATVDDCTTDDTMAPMTVRVTLQLRWYAALTLGLLRRKARDEATALLPQYVPAACRFSVR